MKSEQLKEKYEASQNATKPRDSGLSSICLLFLTVLPDEYLT
jgi:hypothetical protein